MSASAGAESKRRKFPSKKILEMSDSLSDVTQIGKTIKIKRVEEVFNESNDRSAAMPSKSDDGALTFPDRTVIWRGKEAVIRMKDNVLMKQNPADKAYLCFMGRCHGLASYDSEDLFLAHVSESHCKSGAKGGMAFQFWRWKVEKPLQCSHCNLRFAEAAKLADHLCDKSVMQNAHLAGRSVGAGEKQQVFYECSICGLRSTTASGKLNHERTHFEKRHVFGDPLRCKKCDYKATSESQLWIHENEHAIKRKVKRLKTDPTSNSDAPPSADCCGSSSDDVTLARKTKLTNENRALESSNKYPECASCGKVFFSQASLQRHPCAASASSFSTAATTTAAAIPTLAPSIGLPSASSSADPLLDCKLCSVSFDARESLALHSRASHPLCHVCGRRFLDESRLQSHVDSHPKCDFCLELFVDAAHLVKHGQRHPKCPDCRQRFLTQENFQMHAALCASIQAEKTTKATETMAQTTTTMTTTTPPPTTTTKKNSCGDGKSERESRMGNSSPPSAHAASAARRDALDVPEKTCRNLSCDLCGEEFQSQAMILIHRAESHAT